MKTSIATVSLSGDLEGKLEAIAAAGFDGFELFEPDFTASSITPEELRERCVQLDLAMFALQPFRDFEGLLDAARGLAFTRAEHKFDLMARLGTDLLLIPSNCSPHSVDGVNRAATDLHELGERAAARGFTIGFEALAWGRHVRDWMQAWEIVRAADHPAVKLVIDTYHLFVRGNPVAPLRDVPVEKIAIVQLADAPSLDMEVLRHSRHMRNFPGQGDYPVVDVLNELLANGFDGVLSHEIFNDDFRTAPSAQTARDGYRSLVWLEEKVVRQSQRSSLLAQPATLPSWTNSPRPLPTAEMLDFSFIEFAVPAEFERIELDAFLVAAGFTRTHRHRSKAVDLYGQGGAWIAVNAEPKTYTRQLANQRSTAVSGIGFLTDDANAALARATAYQCDEVVRERQPAELDLPAIAGVGGTLVYFVDRAAQHFTTSDFETLSSIEDHGQSTNEGVWLRLDHVSQAVAPYELLSALLFYRAVMGLELLPAQEFADLNGLVTSRTVVSPNRAVRIPLNMAAAGATSPERFRSVTQGSGVQHVAFAATDLTQVLARIDPSIVLPISSNYYEDLMARFSLDKAFVDRLRESNLLYDRADGGEYLHLYTYEHRGVFVEFVQRVNYQGFGAANAPVRLAAQASTRERSGR